MRVSRVLATVAGTVLATATLSLVGPSAQATALTSCHIGEVLINTPWGTYSNITIDANNTYGYNVITAPAASTSFTSVGTGGADAVFGTNGNDFLSGGAGNDLICGGAGNDFLGAQAGGLNPADAAGPNQAGDDYYVGGADGSAAGRTVFAGVDRIVDGATGGSGTNILIGQGGNDLIRGGPDAWGGSGNDAMFTDGVVAIYYVYGEAGNDRLVGDAGTDRLYGGPGTDYLDGKALADRLWGDDGNDTLLGGGAADQLYGGAGDDNLNGEGGVNTNDGGTNGATGDTCLNPNTAGGAVNCEH